MTFYPGDRVIYPLTRREYIVEKCYIIIHDDQKIELIDVKPLAKHPGDKFRLFKGYNAKHYKLIKRNET